MWFRLLPALLTISALLCLGAATSFKPSIEAVSASPEETPKFLPRPALVKLTTLGYDSAASDALWFLTVNYFGKSFRNQGDFRWLHHYCTLTTELNPKIVERYELCATLLSWMAKKPQASNDLLDAAIKANPDKWRLRYLRAFNHWFFLNDPQSGAEDLKVAATLPEAPPTMSSLASRLISTSGDPQLAVDYLEESLMRTESETARTALSLRLRQAILSRDIHKLDRLVQQFNEEKGRQLQDLEELVRADYLEEIPQEPFGGTYLWNSELGRVISTSGKKGLELPKGK